MLLFIDNARHANIMRHRKDRNEKLFSCMHFFFIIFWTNKNHEMSTYLSF